MTRHVLGAMAALILMMGGAFGQNSPGASHARRSTMPPSPMADVYDRGNNMRTIEDCGVISDTETNRVVTPLFGRSASALSATGTYHL
jgi:hypothetical protein